MAGFCISNFFSFQSVPYYINGLFACGKAQKGNTCMLMHYIDKKVNIRRCGDKKLKSKLLKSYIESEGGYDAGVMIINCDDPHAFVELETYSGMFSCSLQ